MNLKSFTPKQLKFLESLKVDPTDNYTTTCSYECMAHERQTANALKRKGFITIEEPCGRDSFEIYLTPLGVELMQQVDNRVAK